MPVAHRSSLVNLAAVAIGLGEAQAARTHAMRALQSDGADADAWVNLGVASWHAGLHREAAQATDRALRLVPGMEIARIRGKSRAILSAERTALNYLCHLSGVASATHSIAEAIKPFGTRVTCTRKTMPGLRSLQKYAVRVGGGSNHRFGLDDAVLIKDNHIALAGDVATAVGRARAGVGHMVKIELEVDTLAQLEVALQLGVDVVLLDNMSLDDLRTAVGMCKGRAITEASGRITPETAPAVAATGVDQIAVGWLTHSAKVLDIGLDA